MKVQFGESQQEFTTLGNKVTLVWNEETISVGGLGDEDAVTVYQYDSAVWYVPSTRDKIIESIIGSKYSVSSEIATINNKEDKPAEYQEYQAFRQFAKDKSSEYLGN